MKDVKVFFTLIIFISPTGNSPPSYDYLFILLSQFSLMIFLAEQFSFFRPFYPFPPFFQPFPTPPIPPFPFPALPVLLPTLARVLSLLLLTPTSPRPTQAHLQPFKGRLSLDADKTQPAGNFTISGLDLTKYKFGGLPKLGREKGIVRSHRLFTP